MTKKILLINPAQFQPIAANQPEIYDKEIDYLPSLGILYLASYLKKFGNHEIKIADCGVENISYDGIGDIAKDFKPDIVGITALTFVLLDVIAIIKAIKTSFPGTLIVLGGPHPNLYPNETINLPGVDFIVLGEGEKPFKELIDNIDDREKLKTTPGLIFKLNGEIINTGHCELISNLDELPFPARQLTKYDKYFSIIAQKSPVTTMFTSRGCPYRCLFCDRPYLGKIFRARSAKNVVDEMAEIKKMGIEEIFIYDDTFTINRQRTIDICHEVINRKLEINWDIRARVNTVDEEVLHWLKIAGCRRIHFGVEAGTQKILDILKKDITLEMVEKVIGWTKKEGIETLAYFMIGNPSETLADIEQTIAFAKKIDPDYINVSITTPFPGTQLYDQALETGIIKSDVWREFAANPSTQFIPPLWTENFSRDELIGLMRQFYGSFYRRPKYIIKKLLAVKSWGELVRKAKAGWQVLKF
ncbi:MAG: radical SAM protein [Patescibacteria group bacterium]